MNLPIPTNEESVAWAEEADRLARALLDLVEAIEDSDLAPDSFPNHMRQAREVLEHWPNRYETDSAVSRIQERIRRMRGSLLREPVQVSGDAGDLLLTERDKSAIRQVFAAAETKVTPEQIVYSTAQRDPGFRRHLIEQLTAMGEGVIPAKSDAEVQHEDSYWDDPLRATNKA